MQDRPVCFKCNEKIEYDPLYEAPCGPDHEDCSSAVFHGICLMEWREHFQTWIKRVEQHMREHHHTEEEGDGPDH